PNGLSRRAAADAVDGEVGVGEHLVETAGVAGDERVQHRPALGEGAGDEDGRGARLARGGPPGGRGVRAGGGGGGGTREPGARARGFWNRKTSSARVRPATKSKRATASGLVIPSRDECSRERVYHAAYDARTATASEVPSTGARRLPASGTRRRAPCQT